uniref:hypothetical protein n=1 Tax=Salmonella sp. s51228 TaxID=3159652 RepID=UPI003980566B
FFVCLIRSVSCASLHKPNPRQRVLNYLVGQGWWSEAQGTDLIKHTKKSILKLLEKVENLPKPSMDTLFSDVYDNKPPNLINQEKEMYLHLNLYKEQYPQHYHEQ